MKKLPRWAFFLLLTILQCLLINESWAHLPDHTNRIIIMDDAFSPSSLTIASGQKVTWINQGAKDHTVTDKGHFNSGHLHPGAKFSYIFNKPGIYHYACSIHSFLMFGMTGTIIVK